MAELFYISNKAYALLVSTAMAQGFVKQDSERKEGISRFLEQLSNRNFEDTRPGGLKENDQYLISNRRTPVWATGLYPRRSRSLMLDEDTKIHFGVTAMKVGIFIDRWHKGGPIYNSPNSICGAVLEAIGLRYLTPDRWPHALVISEDRLQAIHDSIVNTTKLSTNGENQLEESIEQEADKQEEFSKQEAN